MWAALAALLFGLSAPVTKILLQEIPPAFMAALLYLGAGFGMAALSLIRRARHKPLTEAKITKNELPFAMAMIVLDIAAPVLLMFGIQTTAAANASLLSNFEIVATSLVALLFFREAIGGRLWIAIALITVASMILSIEGREAFSFSPGSALILLACVCWGFENNCTRKLSLKDPTQIVVIKGLGSGAGSLILALLLGESAGSLEFAAAALVLGFFAYGLSIFFYVRAQRELGAARTSAYYAMSPFIGVGLSFIILRETVTVVYLVALVVMIAGAYFAISEKHRHPHTHESVTHDHGHSHADGHHTHTHEGTDSEHSHVHTHEKTTHTHSHTPDTHHVHTHGKK